MSHRYAELAFSEHVRAVQTRMGSRERNQERELHAGPNDVLSGREVEFIHQRDSFYIATIGGQGWPYVQHRGGPRGFLRVANDRTLMFPDYSGNRQYITTGNLEHDDRIALILVDYPARRRLKILGRARAVDITTLSPSLQATFQPQDALTTVDRVFVIDLAAFDWNCSQHITPRFSVSEVQAITSELQQRIALLQAALDRHGIQPT